MRVILRRVAPKGSLSIHGFYRPWRESDPFTRFARSGWRASRSSKSPQRAKRSGRPPARSAGTLTASESERPYL